MRLFPSTLAILVLTACFPTKRRPDVVEPDELIISSGSEQLYLDGQATAGPDTLSLRPKAEEGCPSFIDAEATLNGEPMTTHSDEPVWDPMGSGHWICGSVGAEIDLTDLAVDGEALEAVIEVHGPDIDLSVTVPQFVAVWRFAFDGPIDVISPGTALPFRLTPAAPATIRFFTMFPEGSQDRVEVVVGPGDGGEIAYFPADAPLGPNQLHVVYDQAQQPTVCEGVPECTVQGGRVETLPTLVVARPDGVDAVPPPDDPLWP